MDQCGYPVVSRYTPVLEFYITMDDDYHHMHENRSFEVYETYSRWRRGTKTTSRKAQTLDTIASVDTAVLIVRTRTTLAGTTVRRAQKMVHTISVYRAHSRNTPASVQTSVPHGAIGIRGARFVARGPITTMTRNVTIIADGSTAL
eukprot:scaffold2435_cov165-Amphora_coffeaeformis.AAC.2